MFVLCANVTFVNNELYIHVNVQLTMKKILRKLCFVLVEFVSFHI